MNLKRERSSPHSSAHTCPLGQAFGKSTNPPPADRNQVHPIRPTIEAVRPRCWQRALYGHQLYNRYTTGYARGAVRPESVAISQSSILMTSIPCTARMGHAKKETGPGVLNSGTRLRYRLFACAVTAIRRSPPSCARQRSAAARSGGPARSGSATWSSCRGRR